LGIKRNFTAQFAQENVRVNQRNKNNKHLAHGLILINLEAIFLKLTEMLS
jgi:hypothetical protein